MVDYKTPNNEGFRCKIIIIDIFSKYTCGIPLKNNSTQTITDDFSNNLNGSKRSPPKTESDRGKHF